MLCQNSVRAYACTLNFVGVLCYIGKHIQIINLSKWKLLSSSTVYKVPGQSAFHVQIPKSWTWSDTQLYETHKNEIKMGKKIKI